jgi:hypothetical protein
MLRPRKRPNLLNYLRLGDFAGAAGVTERAVHAWLAKPKIDAEVIADVEAQLGTRIPDPARPEFEPFLRALRQTHPDAFRQLKSNRTKCLSYGIVYKGRAYISLQGAERYLESRGLQRVAARPRNALTVEAAAQLLGCGRWKVYRAVFAGDIAAVIHSQTIYLERRSVEAFHLERRSLLPLPGWLPVREAARQAGRSYTSLAGWLQLHERPVRIFLHPRLRRPCRYMRSGDLEQYRHQAAQTEKHVPRQFRPDRHGH